MGPNSPAFPVLFPVFFALLWLAIIAALSLKAGWYRLAQRYPDREEAPLLQLRRQSGVMGGVNIRGALNLAACPSGLRIGVMRLFGLFNRDFLVPWAEIRITRKDQVFGRVAELTFGEPATGTLVVAAYTADRLARSAAGRWPEPGPFPEEPRHQVRLGVMKEWAALTACAALFFILAPRLITPDGPFLPIPVAIAFPAVVFGIVALMRYASRTKG